MSCNQKTHLCFQNTHLPLYITCRHDDSDTETASTDEHTSWGGLGKFEYSLKGLPHGLLHFKEIIMRGGHWNASCTFLVESAHKEFATNVAQFGRSYYGSQNKSQAGMIKFVSFVNTHLLF